MAVLALLGGPGRAALPEPGGPPPEAAGWRAVTVARGVPHPWGLAWLPDGRALVTARDEAALYLYDDGRFTPVPMDGMPEVLTGGQGGLLDVAVHPDDAALPVRVYLTLSTGTREANRTTLVRGVFDGRRLGGIRTLFRAAPDKSGGQHFGSRLLWLPDGTLLMSIGDGGNPPLRVGGMLAREQAQNLRSHLGSVVRLTDEGRPAPGNPFLGRDDALPEIWTYGHRNIQGLARDPDSGRIWATEHGPLGGDEVNLLQGGGNYGWPLQTHGRDYRTGVPVGQPSVPGTIDPKVVWTPVQAPSGLVFYTGSDWPDWRGSLLSGGLRAQDIRRIALDDEGNVTGQQRLVFDSRVRVVTQGPDGRLYALTDEEDGRLLRIEPQ
ncbi:MAG: PQQ-dependent sugar dehydrogenase [Planctomycetes bacterium]|nr:PQQ-dependent sugar dehydrogenase [Planctomycetota bacterium]